MRKRTAVLISGRGSNMESLIAAAEAPDYPAEIALVISNRPDAKGLETARRHGIASKAIDHKAFPDRGTFEAEVHAALEDHAIDLVALAGFMRILTAGLTAKWSGRMLNIHPSLLPLYPGLDTHQRALDDGVKVHGCTVHHVVPELDAGPIIAQAAVPVMPGDDVGTLAARVLTAEHQLYPQALASVASGRSVIEDGCADQVLISPRLRSR